MTTTVTDYDHRRLYIGGAWQEVDASQLIDLVHPATEEVIGKAPMATPADVERAVAAARRAFDHGPWPRMSVAERADVLRRLADAYAARQDELSTLITDEMGSPITFSRAVQVGSGLSILSNTLELAETYPFEELRTGPYGASRVVREPVGVVGAIVPWNFPQSTIMMKLAPALLAGCTVVLKPSPETPIDGLVVAELAAEAGLPAGVLNVVPGDRDAGEALVGHPDVDKIAFTGSTAAGRKIAARCGQDLRRVTLELGGKSAAIILDDADLGATVETLRDASFGNCGQVCVAQTRLLVSESRHDELVDALGDLVATMPVGDPHDERTQVGPLASRRQLERVRGYVEAGVGDGARIAVGGGRPDGLDRGWFIEPTVFVDVDNSMRIAQEEIFGPVVAVIPYKDEADAIAIANASNYGLSGSVFSADDEHAVAVARQVRTGTVRVNGAYGAPSAPFGGFKDSGIGRELGPEGLNAYFEVKAIAVGTDA